MISSLILLLLFGVLVIVTAPLRLLPDVSLPVELTDAITTAGGHISSLNQVIPITTILIVLGIVLATEGFVFLYKSIKWVYNKIPGVN